MQWSAGPQTPASGAFHRHASDDWCCFVVCIFQILSPGALCCITACSTVLWQRVCLFFSGSKSQPMVFLSYSPSVKLTMTVGYQGYGILLSNILANIFWALLNARYYAKHFTYNVSFNTCSDPRYNYKGQMDLWLYLNVRIALEKPKFCTVHHLISLGSPESCYLEEIIAAWVQTAALLIAAQERYSNTYFMLA